MRISDWSSDVCSSDLNSYSINLPAAAGAPSIGWSILGSDFQIDLELQALQTEGRGEVISSPRVVTANGKQATIEQGREIPYQTSSGNRDRKSTRLNSSH